MQKKESPDFRFSEVGISDIRHLWNLLLTQLKKCPAGEESTLKCKTLLFGILEPTLFTLQ